MLDFTIGPAVHGLRAVNRKTTHDLLLVLDSSHFCGRGDDSSEIAFFFCSELRNPEPAEAFGAEHHRQLRAAGWVSENPTAVIAQRNQHRGNAAKGR